MIIFLLFSAFVCFLLAKLVGLGLVFVNEVEVYLLLEQVDVADTDVDGVAELVAASVTAADDLVVVLIEHVVVVSEAADGYHALALVAFDFGIDAPLADTADEGGEDLT